MSDLISRQALIEEIFKVKQQVFLSEEVGHYRPFSDKSNILECIDNQPTAYDVDKVIEKLELHRVNPYFAAFERKRINEAIDIVKGGSQP